MNILYVLESRHLSRIEPKLDIKLTFIDKTNYEELYKTVNENIPASFKRLITAGEKSLMAIHQNKIIANCFASIGDQSEPLRVNELITIRKGESYIHYCDTELNYRRNNIYSYLLYKLAEHIFQVEKSTKIFIETTPDNLPSQKGILKVGFRQKHVIKRVKLFGKILLKWSSNL